MDIPAQHDPETLDPLTVAQAAAAMRVSKMTVYRMLHAGELPSIRVGQLFRIHRNDLDGYLRRAQHG
ncbi:MAG: helix-turn-helix domain-containing protein [Actinomycetota bacterium]|nr:helix-turn-helix domain-containing protein [Actinomycetota bacterium]